MGEQVPTVGRVVHFVQEPGEPHLAAIVCHVWLPTCVNLAIFDRNGTSRGMTSVLQEEPGPVGAPSNTWHWPERV